MNKVEPLQQTPPVTQEQQGFWEYAATKAPEEDEGYYFKFTLVSVAYFFVLTLLFHLICIRFSNKYRTLDGKNRAIYRSYIVSVAHSLVTVVLATIGMFMVCGEGKNVFNDQVCLNTTRYIHIWALLHTCGYFIQDFYIQFFVIGGRSALDYQTYAHHIIGAFTFYQTLYFMGFMVVFGVMLLFTEVSTTYVSIRWLLFKHEMTESKAYYANAGCMFVFFLFGRLIYQIYITFWMAAPYIEGRMEAKDISFFEGFVMFQMFVMVALSVVLNIWWFFLMARMMWRVLQRMGDSRVDDPTAVPDNIELVKNDALKEKEDEEVGDRSTQGSNLGGFIEVEVPQHVPSDLADINNLEM